MVALKRSPLEVFIRICRENTINLITETKGWDVSRVTVIVVLLMGTCFVSSLEANWIHQINETSINPDEGPTSPICEGTFVKHPNDD